MRLKQETGEHRYNYGTMESLRKIINRMPNWKLPGVDLVQEFWQKKFINLHERFRLQLQQCDER